MMRALRRAVVLAFLLAGCGVDGPPQPSDESFLAARAAAAASIEAHFRGNESSYAPDPEGAGAATLDLWVGNAPDPRPLSEAAARELPPASSRLARCRERTALSFAAFSASAGPFLGEGSMSGAKMTREQRIAEVRRQLDEAVGGFCLWRDATRACRDEAAAAQLPAPPAFEPARLACPSR